MLNLPDRSRFLLTIAAVAVSVLLFACDANREPGPSADIPDRPPVSEAAVTMVAPAPVPQQLQAPAIERHPEPQATEPIAPEPPAETQVAAPGPAPAESTGGPRVFSNKDLSRYKQVKEEFGFGRDVVTVDLRPEKPESDSQAAATRSADERDEEIRDTMKLINDLNSEAAYLKSRIPSLHNPFLARVQPSEADAMAEAGMDNAERLERVKDRLAVISSQLAQLQLRLAQLHQAESGQETP